MTSNLDIAAKNAALAEYERRVDAALCYVEKVRAGEADVELSKCARHLLTLDVDRAHYRKRFRDLQRLVHKLRDSSLVSVYEDVEERLDATGT